jgi:hypothetical protein
MLTKEQIERIQDEFRIPVDSGEFRKFWIACLHAESRMPTDLELRQIRSYIEFSVCSWNEPVKKRVLSMSLPFYGGYHTDIFRKGFNDEIPEGWFRSKLLYSYYVPNPVAEGYAPYSFEELLDSISKNYGQNWHIWRIAHPDIFPPFKTYTPRHFWESGILIVYEIKLNSGKFIQAIVATETRHRAKGIDWRDEKTKNLIHHDHVIGWRELPS